MRLQVHNTRAREGEHIWKTVDQYYSTYWGGLDARIYANDVLLDEIVALQWTLEEAVMPLFGYHDYTFRRAVHGARRVQGSFTINFKRDSYLYELLRTLNEPGITGRAAGRVAPDVNDLSAAMRGARTGRATLDDFMAFVTSGEAAKGTGRVRLDPKELARVAHAFEDAIWKDDRGASEPVYRLTKFTQRNRPRFDLDAPFDLHVQFGEKDASLQNQRQLTVEPGRLGGVQDSRPKDAVSVSTYSRVIGVELSSVGRMVDDSGRPVLESYTFIAQDVV